MDMNFNPGFNIGPAMNVSPVMTPGPAVSNMPAMNTGPAMPSGFGTAPYADMNRERLLKEVMAADFNMIDLNLFLNTHPCDQNALALYNNGAQKARMLRDTFERMYGPLTPNTALSCDRWHWIDDPWPWQKR